MRRHLVPLVLLVAGLGAATVFRSELIVWFRGDAAGDTSAPVRADAGSLVIEAAMRPDRPRQQGNTLVVTVRDRSGTPVVDGTVTVTHVMPAMGSMPEMRGSASVSTKGGGRYEARFDLPMAGSWTLEVRVAGAASGSARFQLTVGTPGLRALGGSGGGASPRDGVASGGALSHEGHGHAGDDVSHYTCSMHPSVRAEDPGQCPICSMDLSAVSYDEEESGVIRIDEARRRQIGVRTSKVVRGPMTRSIRAVGRVAYDESRLKDVTLKLGGWITRLHVSQTGQRVGKGQLLFTLYSPELFAAQQEYLLARASQPGAGSTAGARGDYLVKATERKLQLWGLSSAQIAAIATRGEAIEDMPFYSPASGYVIEKDVVEGGAIEAGQRLFRIAALDRVWVEAEVYEADLALVTKGVKATIALSYQPGKVFEGTVAYVYPYLDRGARTGKARIELNNPGLELKPDMYATVSFQMELGPRLQIPTDAVVYTGPRRLVFVDLGEGRLRPQEVKLGVRSDDMVEVIDGLKEGEVIVTSGNFLVAAESRIRSAAKIWSEERAGAQP